MAANAATVGHEEPLELNDGQLLMPCPGSNSLSSHNYVPSDARSPSASSWKEYRMIDVQSETSMESLAVAQCALSQEAELDLYVNIVGDGFCLIPISNVVPRLNEYFESVQPLYPLFRKQALFNQYNAGQVPQAILASIFANTAALSTNAEIMIRGPNTIGEHYATLARQACSPLCMSDIPATISDLRALFLLALYESRTSPNRRAWATAGHLVRLAYHYGLHQVDNVANCTFYEEGVTTSDDLEGWRYLWWSIYSKNKRILFPHCSISRPSLLLLLSTSETPSLSFVLKDTHIGKY